MATKIGVYFDASNIGGGLDVEALAAGVTAKWGSFTAVVQPPAATSAAITAAIVL